MSDGGATSEDNPETGGRACAGDGAGAGAAGRHAGGGACGHAGDPSAAAAPAPAGRTRRRGDLFPAPVAVSWNERQRRPVAFVWRRRRYRVERVLETWVLETGWWRDDGRVSRAYWRVRAEGRVFDLRYDRLNRSWALERALN